MSVRKMIVSMSLVLFLMASSGMAVVRTQFGSSDCYAKSGSTIEYDQDFALIFGTNYAYGYIWPSGSTSYELLAWTNSNGPDVEADADSTFSFDGYSKIYVKLEANAWGFNYFQVGNGSSSGNNGYVAMLPTSSTTWVVYSGGIFSGQFPSTITANGSGTGTTSKTITYYGNGQFRIFAYSQDTAQVLVRLTEN